MKTGFTIFIVLFLLLRITPLNAGSSSVKKILIIGDSHAYSLEDSLNKSAGDYSQWSIKLKGVSSTGLARRDYFDWIGWSGKLTDTYDFVFIILGTNDGQNMTGSESLIFGSKAWEFHYSARVEQLLYGLRANKKIYWVFVPQKNKSDMSRKTEYIQALIKEVSLFHDAQILETSFIPAYDSQSFFKEDGIHLNNKGNEFLTSRIFSVISKMADKRLP